MKFERLSGIVAVACAMPLDTPVAVTIPTDPARKLTLPGGVDGQRIMLLVP